MLAKNKICVDFFNQLSKNEKSTLLLDYDGTLAPFKKNRKKAFIHPKIQKELQELLLCKNTNVIIISGRTIKDLLSLLNFSPLPEIWGCHGLEKRSQNGRYHREKIEPIQKKGLLIAKKMCKEIVPSECYEMKPFSLAVHVRGLSKKKKMNIFHSILPLWEKITDPYKLELISFDEGCEIRVKGKNKGTAVMSIVSKFPKKHVIAYLGDDITDEDAFLALGKKGLKVLVRDKKNMDVDMRIKTYNGVASFLRQWRQAIHRGEMCHKNKTK